MIAKLFAYLQYEQQLLNELLDLSERQKKALIRYNLTELNEVTAIQDTLSKNFREAEEGRISLLIKWLKISRRDAMILSLSALETYCQPEELTELRKFKDELNRLINTLHNQNVINRVLTNRARNGVREILHHFTNGYNQVCNVKI